MTQTIQAGANPSIVFNDPTLVGAAPVTVLKLNFTQAEAAAVNADYVQIIINNAVVATIRIR